MMEKEDREYREYREYRDSIVAQMRKNLEGEDFPAGKNLADEDLWAIAVRVAMVDTRDRWKDRLHDNIVGAMENWFFGRLLKKYEEKTGEKFSYVAQKWEGDVASHMAVLDNNYTRKLKGKERALEEVFADLDASVRKKKRLADVKVGEVVGKTKLPVSLDSQDVQDFFEMVRTKLKEE